MARDRKNISCKAIAFAQKDLIDELGIPLELADKTCWACRYEFTGTSPERAHIEAVKHYGWDTANNYFLLCSVCHNEQPDGADRDYQIRWLKKRRDLESNFDSSIEFVKKNFESMTGHSLEELIRKMMDEHGTKGMLDRFQHALREGQDRRARVTYISGMANAVARLVEIWNVLSIDDKITKE